MLISYFILPRLNDHTAAIEAQEANMADVKTIVDETAQLVASSHQRIARRIKDTSGDQQNVAESNAIVDRSHGRLDSMSQAEKFRQAARDLGTDESEDAFQGVLRKLATATPEKR